ncbi:hypothetical protein M501DRAFT_965729 [Patellaria atrata CBS 101060]|uniref:Fe2OG dioxygenase domain-containing protein n=1 Tax=Patellaria atrata CBS 101060 TaxID=1346257 RepID=A0A9P4VVC7_9PEZI|nr:hypothetical protein M501DRAFT_965729 [Patellaria atrata CBS 101060]
MQDPSFQPSVKSVAPHNGTTADTSVEFDPAKHILFQPPSKIIKMTDIGYAEDTGVSPVAVSHPFQLFSEDAIGEMRKEIFKKEVLANCKYESNIAACQLRGYSPKYAKFIYDAWKHPDTLSIISKIAGVDLVPEMDFEIGHVNLSIKSKEQTDQEIAAISNQKRFFADDEGIAGCPWEDDKPIVGWHTDSYPFVCVLMLSDCTNMVGGETALRTPDGNILKVRGPGMGCAVILQGRYITHQALRALGTKERITMVTSFRPKSPFLADDSVLRTVRPISDLSELYYDFGEYRLEIMEARINARLKVIRDRRRAGKRIDTSAFKKFLQEQIAFLAHTNSEIVEEDQVTVGYIEEMDIPDVKVEAMEVPKQGTKRARTD